MLPQWLRVGVGSVNQRSSKLAQNLSGRLEALCLRLDLAQLEHRVKVEALAVAGGQQLAVGNACLFLFAQSAQAPCFFVAEGGAQLGIQ